MGISNIELCDKLKAFLSAHPELNKVRLTEMAGLPEGTINQMMTDNFQGKGRGRVLNREQLDGVMNALKSLSAEIDEFLET